MRLPFVTTIASPPKESFRRAIRSNELRLIFSVSQMASDREPIRRTTRSTGETSKTRSICPRWTRDPVRSPRRTSFHEPEPHAGVERQFCTNSRRPCDASFGASHREQTPRCRHQPHHAGEDRDSSKHLENDRGGDPSLRIALRKLLNLARQIAKLQQHPPRSKVRNPEAQPADRAITR